MPQPKKLIEVAMPVKEVSDESVYDKYIHHGHISTLHIWWARRPLPVCRAVVFASLVPDPIDENCPQQFKDAVNKLLAGSIYKPYEDIPFTASVDPMEDNPRNRLLMFIGKYSKKFLQVEKSGNGTCAPKETLDNGSLIKWENKNNEAILDIARKLIFVAHNSAAVAHAEVTAKAASTTAADSAATASDSTAASVASAAGNSANSPLERGVDEVDGVCKTCDELLTQFDHLYSAIKQAESDLYETPNRHLQTDEVKQKEETLHNAIETFLDKMPKVYDPFAGGGAIPLEAARLGCRTYANDLNPVAHIIEKASLEFPQKYGKPITYTKDEFIKIYGVEEFYKQDELKNVFGNEVNINNRLAFDVEYFAKKLLKMTEDEVGHLYPADEFGNKPLAYYWARVVTCSNPTCKAEVPLIRQFELSDKKGKKIYLKPSIEKNKISFEIKKGNSVAAPWIKRGNLTCPCCGNTTDIKNLKQQFINNKTHHRLIATIWEGKNGKEYKIPASYENIKIELNEDDFPKEQMPLEYTQAIPSCTWGIKYWGDLFSKRQLSGIISLVKNLNNLDYQSIIFNIEYFNAIKTYLSIWIDRSASYLTMFGRWISQNEQLTSLFGRQAIPMIFDYPEVSLFSVSTSGPLNQLDWILMYLNEENKQPFSAYCLFGDGSNIKQFKKKELAVCITDPPYYDAIGYADLSDFFYIWLKRTLKETYPQIFATPQTPKMDECTALRHHHNNNIAQSKEHFEDKLKQIFVSVETQTKDLVSIMFAHQSTEAWTTLCNSILGSNMNITSSWSIDSERDTRVVANSGAALQSSITVSCRPIVSTNVADSKEVKKSIETIVKKEVEELYKLGFRGADLLTACFGPAVSVFGKYERVEKASGEEVTVEELLTWARDAAFNAIVSDIPTDDFTRFYIGWLNLFGFSETDHDDVRRITQIGLHLDVNELLTNHLLIRSGNKQTLAPFQTRAAENKKLGESKDSFTIDRVHKAMYLLKNNNRKSLLTFISAHAQNQEDIFWRVANSLKEVLPKGMEDQKQVSELLANKDNLIKESKNITSRFGEQEELNL